MSNQVLKNDQLEPDPWQLYAAVGTFPACNSPVIFTLAEWQTDHSKNLCYLGKKGIILENTDDAELLVPDLPVLDLICIDFPEFTDGRGYSQAKLLRNRYGFSNELRAVGDVLIDQLFLMKRCGFDSFALKAGQKLEDAQRNLTPFTHSYQ